MVDWELGLVTLRRQPQTAPSVILRRLELSTAWPQALALCSAVGAGHVVAALGAAGRRTQALELLAQLQRSGLEVDASLALSLCDRGDLWRRALDFRAGSVVALGAKATALAVASEWRRGLQLRGTQVVANALLDGFARVSWRGFGAVPGAGEALEGLRDAADLQWSGGVEARRLHHEHGGVSHGRLGSGDEPGDLDGAGTGCHHGTWDLKGVGHRAHIHVRILIIKYACRIIHSMFEWF